MLVMLILTEINVNEQHNLCITSNQDKDVKWLSANLVEYCKKLVEPSMHQIICHREYSQSEYRKAVEHLMVLHPLHPAYHELHLLY